MGTINQIWDKTHYFKVKQLDGTWCIAKGYPSGPIIKDKLTKEEADAYLKLLKEQ